ncbi:MAG: hypothetical protein KC438_12410 [Thermomicrobiales bacterium]|nr:hypothetical protein [Thermomicrobiales bacterium]
MQNDSGNLPADDELIEGEELPSAREPEVDTPPQGQPAVARQPPWSEQLRETLRRPAGWGLVALVLVVLLVQVWLLYI